MKVRHFFLRNILKLLKLSHAFLPQIVAKLSTLKQVRFLLDHPV